MDNAAEILTSKVRQCLGHEPTAEQQQAMNTFSRFMTSGDMQSVMLLRGSAGTGKTTLAAAIVKALTAMGQKIVLMAPTGRAAKVFSLYADHNAFTIHRRIYRQKSAGDLSSFNLNANLQRDTLFIVDEASMIYSSSGTDTFGSGSLMDDLIAFVYQGEGCRLMLIGDQAQLPPVGEELSPALHTEALGAYGLTVFHADLNQVLRQSSTSGILWNATQVRAILEEGMETGDLSLPRFRLHGFADITVVPGDELIESLASSYSRVGTDQTMVITRSNKRANIYNQGIRRTVLDCEDELCRGDRLMIVKNNYHWISVESKTESVESKLYTPNSTLYTLNSKLSFLANGDCCVVQRVRHSHELYGFRFADVTLQLPDYDDYELTATVILDSLKTEAPALTREQQELLYNNVMEDYGDIPLKADRIKKLKEDAHYNALQVKYGYAVTCHKAQGGQWAHVYIDQGYMTDDMLTPDYLHWLYTALTRATEHVFLVNWPAAQVESTVIS
jgi:tRNA A37 threonylcarbamoyladenosine biosynthesis protein TsaE